MNVFGNALRDTLSGCLVDDSKPSCIDSEMSRHRDRDFVNSIYCPLNSMQAFSSFAFLISFVRGMIYFFLKKTSSYSSLNVQDKTTRGNKAGNSECWCGWSGKGALSLLQGTQTRGLPYPPWESARTRLNQHKRSSGKSYRSFLRYSHTHIKKKS